MYHCSNNKSNSFSGGNQGLINNNNILKEKEKENNNKSKIEKQNFNWFNYIYYKEVLRKNYKKMKLFSELRTQIISEEKIFQNYFHM